MSGSDAPTMSETPHQKQRLPVYHEQHLLQITEPTENKPVEIGTLFVVMAAHGAYEDDESWPCAVYGTEPEARQHVTQAENEMRAWADKEERARMIIAGAFVFWAKISDYNPRGLPVIVNRDRYWVESVSLKTFQ